MGELPKGRRGNKTIINIIIIVIIIIVIIIIVEGRAFLSMQTSAMMMFPFSLL